MPRTIPAKLYVRIFSLVGEIYKTGAKVVFVAEICQKGKFTKAPGFTFQTYNKDKNSINDFLALRSLGRKGFDSVTPYMHFPVCHVPFFTKKYGKHLRFSGQGMEKINDDIKQIHHSKPNKQTNNLSRKMHIRSNAIKTFSPQ
jgi:hypothetical protein